MREQLATFVEYVKTDKKIDSFDEASTKLGIVLRLLSILNWDTFNVDEVAPEYFIGGARVDYSLKIENINKVFIEAKKTGEELESHQEQLLKYAFQEGVTLAILTNGITWWFYLPLREIPWEERRFYTIDIREQETEEILSKFVDLLSKENVASGKAITNAEEVFKGYRRNIAISDTLPKAWNKIIEDADEVFVDLIGEMTEKLCGYKPDRETVERFMSAHEDRLLIHPREAIPKRGKARVRDEVVTGRPRGRASAFWAYLSKQYPKLSPDKVMLRIQINDESFHDFRPRWENPGSYFMVLSDEGLSRKPTHAAKEIFGQLIPKEYGNIARKHGIFVDISSGSPRELVEYKVVEDYAWKYKLFDKGSKSITEIPGEIEENYFERIDSHKLKAISKHISNRKPLWDAWIQKGEMHISEFHKLSHFKPKGISGFLQFLIANKIASRSVDTFKLNEENVPHIKRYL